MTSNADLIVSSLMAAGITEGFGIPSGNVLPLMEAMRSAGMRFVLTAHEGSAGFAADVTGRLTGRPGLCIATHGPGATNLTTGVAGAFLDRSPLIAITCNIPIAQLGRRIQMHIPHHELFRSITKASLPLRAGSIAATIAEAIALAMSEPMGPVHLDLPEDVALAPCDELPVAPRLPIRLAAASPSSLAEASRLIAAARRPIAIVGTSAMRLQNPDLLRRFVETHRIPFTTTCMAKGLIDDDHELALGCIERARRQVQRALLRTSDLVIGLGYDTIEVEYEAFLGDRPLLHIGIEEADTDCSVRIAQQLVGDLDATLAALIAAGQAASDWTLPEIAAHRDEFQRSLRPRTAAFSPHEAIDVVRKILPRDGILAFDVGAHTHQIASQWPAHTPRSFLVTNGWSSMGFGLPAAIAAKLACPDRPVVAIIGDGCFQMTCGEVVVAKRLGLSLPIVVLNDRWLALMKVKQQRRNYALHATELDDESVAPPAHYFGVPTDDVTDAASLADALTRALAAKGPTIIEARIDPSHYTETVYD